MIYIFYVIIYFAFIIFKPDAKLSDTEHLPFIIWLGILPIWCGIRQCVNELEKIRKMMEGKEG
jgi:hypothetical protein